MDKNAGATSRELTGSSYFDDFGIVIFRGKQKA
jgi:hypothetical protein